jgi:hypothetical protein
MSASRARDHEGIPAEQCIDTVFRDLAGEYIAFTGRKGKEKHMNMSCVMFGIYSDRESSTY